MKKGFTLIEVLISLVILSIIAIVSTNFLQSSIDLRNQSKSKVDDIKVFNLGVSTIRRDLMSTVNLPMRDNFGNQLPNFIGSNTDKKITFLGFINRIDSSRSSISRIEYLFDDTKFIRRVYFTADPYDYNDHIDSVFIDFLHCHPGVILAVDELLEEVNLYADQQLDLGDKVGYSTIWWVRQNLRL